MKQAPRFLNLLKISLPLTALISISHRITGVFLSASLLWMLYTLYFLKVCNEFSWRWLTSHPLWYIPGYLIITAFLFHICAGVRHIFDDVFGTHSLTSANRGSIFVIFGWICLLVLIISTMWVLT